MTLMTTPFQARQKKKRKGAACISLEKPFYRACGKGVKGLSLEAHTLAPLPLELTLNILLVGNQSWAQECSCWKPWSG